MTAAPSELFEQIASALVDGRPWLSRNARGSLVVSGTVRAMTSRGRIVVRLEPGRAAEVRASGEGTAYKDQPNRWVELRADLPEVRTASLVSESCEVRGSGAHTQAPSSRRTDQN